MNMNEKKNLPLGFTLHGKKDYIITSVLGKGGYGITYLAQHTQQGHNIPDKYAIKEFFMPSCCQRNLDGSVTLSDTESKSANEYRKSFKIEAEHLMDLNQYSGIVHVQEIIEANGTVYYVMEHLGDTTLTSLLSSQGGRLEETLAMRLVECVGKSLTILHKKKMNHLDVKPDNIMLVGGLYEVQPVLIDFGLSRHYNIMGKVTSDKTPMGFSDGYSPAEQYVGLDTFSPSADVYALAATLFHILTGHVPERATKISEKYIREELKGRTSDKRIEAIVNAMKMNATERTQSIEDFLVNLGLVVDDKPLTGGTVDISDVKRYRFKWLYVIVAAVIVVLVCVIATLMLKKENSDTSNQESSADTLSLANVHIQQPLVSEPEKQEQANAPQQTQNTESQAVASNNTQNNSIQTVSVSSVSKEGAIDLGYAVWNGDIRNGKPHGYGTMTYKSDRLVDSRDPNETYAAAGDRMEGEFRNGHWEYGTLYNRGGAVKSKISIGAE